MVSQIPVSGFDPKPTMPSLVKRIFWTAAGAIVAGYLFGTFSLIPAQAVDATPATKKTLLQAFPRKQPKVLGSPQSTNLVAYRDYCSNPRDLSQITELCISLGVFTGQNPDGSVEFDDLPDASTATVSTLSPEEATSAPKIFPLGLISPEQNDKVQLFSSP
ncbi:MAG: hypothetical protein NW224_27470 [Leptolyngbyaceae cyanobacterium bins.302]|nr:hypothetical protein [Leptolyngbyaceae cyanobacterium bins.302]